MALRRTARVWFAPFGGNDGSIVRPGQRAWDFQLPSRDSLRRENRCTVRPADAFGRKAGAHLHLQQLALRSRCPGLRLRLLARLSEHALLWGSAFRRFLKWRA